MSTPRVRPFTWPFPTLESPAPPWDDSLCECGWSLCNAPCVVASAAVLMSWTQDRELSGESRKVEPIEVAGASASRKESNEWGTGQADLGAVVPYAA